jgi:sugar phosphate isomerase/epimerase
MATGAPGAPLLGLHPATIPQAADLEQRARVTRAAGFGAWSLRGREIREALDAGHTAESLSALCARHGLVNSDIGALTDWQWTDHPPLVNRQPDPAGRSARELWALVDSFFETATALRVPTVVAVGARNELGSLADAVRAFRDICDRAAPFGLRVAYEVLGAGRVIRTFAQAWDVVRQADRANGGLLLDMFQFATGGSRLETLLDIPVERILLVRLSDAAGPADRSAPPTRVLPGEGTAPLREVVAWLHGGAYRGCYSVEVPHPALQRLSAGEAAGAAYAAAAGVLGWPARTPASAGPGHEEG